MMYIDEEKKANAERCIQVAEVAFASNDFDKAEKFLLKAEKQFPTQLAKRILESVRTAKNCPADAKSNDNDITPDCKQGNSKEEYKYYRSDVDVRYAEICIEKAKSFISTIYYDKAEEFLRKSKRIYPCKEADELLDQLKDLRLKSSGRYVSNKTYGTEEDADKCIEKSQEEFAAGNLAKAEKQLRRSERMFPTERAKDLLKQIEDARARGQPDVGIPVERQRKPSVHKEEERPKVVGPTPDQIDVVQKVNQSGDDYAMFGIDRRSPPNAVKKAYRRLAAQLHPDKNKAPGAREAFLVMREAYDRIKRQQRA